MKIAFIIPKLAKKGPVILVRDLVEQIKSSVGIIHVYYFDEVSDPIEIDCVKFKISFFTQIDFSEYDIVHSHMFRPDIYVWMNRIIRKRNKVKFVTTIHQDIFQNLRFDYNFIVAFFVGRFWLYIIGSFDNIVFLTKTMKNLYDSRFKDLKRRLKIINNGRSLSDNLQVPLNKDDETFMVLLKEKYKIIGSHCLCNKRKGLDQILNSLVFLDDYCFVHIGDGPERDKLIKLSFELGVNDRCYFLGFRSNAVLFIDYFDIYAMTSISEGFPLALLEAGQKSKPVVCSNIPIFKELFSENEVTFFELFDSESLIKAILKSFEFKDTFGENIKKSILKNYSIQIMSSKYLDIYKK